MTARFPLHALSFPHSRELDQSSVDKLRRVFQVGFHPQRKEHRIPAIIDEAQLTDLLGSSRLVDDDGDGEFTRCLPPVGFRLECLHGRHRVRAAEMLFGSSSTWVVDLYSTDTSQKTRNSFMEHYENERPPDDGEIYFRIRKYGGVYDPKQLNPPLQRWWTARCSWSQNAAVQRLKKHPNLMSALDRLYPLKALHPGLQLGSIQRLLSLNCEEEIKTLLHGIWEFWEFVFGEEAMATFSSHSLQQLQGSAPGAVEREATALRGSVTVGNLLGEFGCEDRLRYFERVVQKTRRIVVPSLSILFKNLTHLERVTLNIKQLLPPLRLNSRGSTIREALRQATTTQVDDGRVWIQTDALTLRSYLRAHDNRFELTVRQIWLNAFRRVGSKPPCKSPRTPGSDANNGNPYALHQHALLARALGVETREIDELCRQDPNLQMAVHVLGLSLRPGYVYPSEELHPIAQELASHIQLCRQRTEESVTPVVQDSALFGGDGAGSRGKPFGVPSKNDFERDWPRMFLGEMYSGNASTDEAGEKPSSFFVARSLYLSLFGDQDVQDIRLGQPGESRTLIVPVSSEPTEPVEGVVAPAAAREEEGTAGTAPREREQQKHALQHRLDREDGSQKRQRRAQGHVQFMSTRGWPVDTATTGQLPPQERRRCERRAQELRQASYELFCSRAGKWTQVQPNTCYDLAVSCGFVVARSIHESQQNIKRPEFYAAAAAADHVGELYRESIEDHLVPVDKTSHGMTTIYARNRRYRASSEEGLRRLARDGLLYCIASTTSGPVWQQVDADTCADKNRLLLLRPDKSFPACQFMAYSKT